MYHSSKLGEDRSLASVDADLFLTSIAENFSRVCNSLVSCFLRPGAHLIFILVEPIAAKDVTLYKGCRGDVHQLYAGGEIIGVFRPPGGGEDVTWMVYPLRARDAIAMAEVQVKSVRGFWENTISAIFHVFFLKRGSILSSFKRILQVREKSGEIRIVGNQPNGVGWCNMRAFFHDLKAKH
jgi:hypothetical protein